MLLSKNFILNNSTEQANEIERINQLPEKVLQFGTGVLLRGLPDYYIDQANKQGIFNGRIVVVKSTTKNSSDDFSKQDNLYTHCISGFENEQVVDRKIINSSISRVLNANDQWKEILECAKNKDLQIVISNTTEAGIQLVEENIFKEPPVSFPAKLLSFLFERYRCFTGDLQAGMVIVPTELIMENGTRLLSILLSLAAYNQLEEGFINWLKNSNRFCNSLVDRIVPGKPSEEKLNELFSELNYEDDFLIVSEPYSLWAIEGDDDVKNKLSFCASDPSVIIEQDIQKYRELKLRLLNGTHILSCSVALMMELEFVHEAMKDEVMKNFVERLMKEEIGKAIPMEIPEEEINTFSSQVIDRFRNPNINHKWRSISLQYTSKMVLRNIPVLLEWYKRYETAPRLITFGFASYFYFMRPYKKGDGYYANFNGREYVIEDVFAESLSRNWEEIMGDVSIWGTDLKALPGFYENVLQDLARINKDGMRSALQYVLNL